jgi:hypothetical protein
MNEVWSSGGMNEVWSSGGMNEVWSRDGMNEVWSSGGMNEVWSSGGMNEVWINGGMNEVWSNGGMNERKKGKVNSNGQFYMEWKKEHHLLESSQVSPARPSGRSSIKMRIKCMNKTEW